MEKNRKIFLWLIPCVAVLTLLIATAVTFAAVVPEVTINVNAGDTVNEKVYTVTDPVAGADYHATLDYNGTNLSTNVIMPDGLSIVYKDGSFYLVGTAPDQEVKASAYVTYREGVASPVVSGNFIGGNIVNVNVSKGADSHNCYLNFLDDQNKASQDIIMHNGKVGEKYSYSFSVDTCAGEAYKVSAVDNLPLGLEIIDSKTVVGVPEEAGTFSFWVNGKTNSDMHNATARAKYTVTITDGTTPGTDPGTDPGTSEKISFDIPVEKIVKMDGDVAPPSIDINFVASAYGYSGDINYEVTDNSIKTGSGAGTTKGTITITVNSVNDLYNLSEGVVIREQPTKDKNWEYDDTRWVVMPVIKYDEQQNPTVTGVSCYEMDATGGYTATVSGSDSISFTNEYTKKDGSDEDYPYTYPNGDYTLTYVSNGGTTYATEKYPKDQVVNLSKVPAKEGYTFTGWYLDSALKTQATSVVMDSNKKVYAGWKEGEDAVIKECKLTYETNGGNTIASEMYTKNATASLTKVPVRSGYTFTGWYNDKAITNKITSIKMDTDKTVYAGWVPEGTVPGGEKYTLTYETNGGSAIAPKICDPNEKVSLTNAPVKEAYTFTGWYSDSALSSKITSVTMDSDKTVYAGWQKTPVPTTLNGDNHFAYVIGYEDGTVRPANNITRAEVATIFFRLLKPEIRDGNLKKDNSFKDSKVGDWYNTPVSTLAGIGVINGRTADTFAPGSKITRAEFATICARFDTTSVVPETSRFTDTKGHWAESYIEKAASLGWIKGYADGTFKPDQYITRAEAMTLINRVTNRIPENTGDLLTGMRVWSDNASSTMWYYLAVQEATNSHDFAKKSEINERWTKLTPDPDWTKYN